MQAPAAPIVKDLVLVGGGHSHVIVLKRFAMRPIPGVRITLVSREPYTPYSGMLPGLIAGHYGFDDIHIDLGRLARFAGARAYFAEAIGLDLANRRVLCRDRPPVPYDIVSLDLGSSPNIAVPGAAEHAVPVKPINRFLSHFEAMRERLAADGAHRRVAVVGGGAGGVEILLAVQHRLHAFDLEFHLFTDTAEILPTLATGARARFARILDERRVAVHTGHRIVEVGRGWLRTADGVEHPADEVLWTTEAAAPAWPGRSGLAVDAHGFVAVAPSLESISHPGVFAAGDVAAVAEHPRPKSGVFAVRQGKPLAANLRRALVGRPLRPFTPQQSFLSLVSTGDRYAVASRGEWSAGGQLVWRWKDWIDRRFMRLFNELPEMKEQRLTSLPKGLADTSELAALATNAMRCGGCGAKVGADVLARGLGDLAPVPRGDVLVGLAAPDDAAVVEVPPGKAMVHSVDFFRAMIEDPYMFAQIAANHCLGDIYAMGGEPQTALAIVTIPPALTAKMEDTLGQITAGATEVLHAAGAALVGGHTGEGAELAVGFAVNGLIDRDRVMRKGGLRPGDALILAKPIGTGVLFAADARHRAKSRWIAAAIAAMLRSNRAAAECFLAHGARACTDVTGFGLMGHLIEMLRASGTGAEISLAAIPLLDGAAECVRAGIASSLQPENLRARRSIAHDSGFAGTERFALLFDPQTAGGLLAGIPADKAQPCLAALRQAGYDAAAIIGTATAPGDPERPVALRD
jgi:selenide,water dikinase